LGWGSAVLAARAKQLRRNPTEPEIRLWRALSNCQLAGLKFRRQAPIGVYIADFFCPAIGLIVEVDGHTHDAASDAGRDRDMERVGFHTLRVGNTEVMSNLDGVLARIIDVAASRPQRSTWRLPHPNPSPEGEGLR
jgi:very-short-patch-repair endonuclease